MSKIFAVLLTVFFLPASAGAIDKIKVATADASAAQITHPLAQKRGFYKEEGIHAEVIFMRGNVPLAALVNGDIDYIGNMNQGVRGVLAGLPFKVLASYTRSTFTLVARSEIKSAKELKGKRLAVGTPGGGPDVLGRMILQHFGLDFEKEIQLVRAGSNEPRVAILKQGLADATIVLPPWDFHVQKMGFIVLARAHELFAFPAEGLIAHTKKIKDRPDEVKRVIKAGIKANRYIRENRDGTIQFLMEWLRTNREIATAIYESVSKSFSDDGCLPEEALRLVVEENKKATKLDREVSLSDVADLSILREAQRELGIKGK